MQINLIDPLELLLYQNVLGVASVAQLALEVDEAETVKSAQMLYFCAQKLLWPLTPIAPSTPHLYSRHII